MNGVAAVTVWNCGVFSISGVNAINGNLHPTGFSVKETAEKKDVI